MGTKCREYLFLLGLSPLISPLKNTSKIVLNIQHTMALDPCRRFTFGITVEGTSARLWFCSRATPVVSEVFDIVKVCVSYQLV